ARRLLVFDSGGGGVSFTLLSRRGIGPVSRGHLGEGGSYLDRLVGLGEDLGDRARRGGRDLGVDLVGRDLDHGLALLDRATLGYMPFENRPLGNRFAHLGHLVLDRCGLCHSRPTSIAPPYPPKRPAKGLSRWGPCAWGGLGASGARTQGGRIP